MNLAPTPPGKRGLLPAIRRHWFMTNSENENGDQLGGREARRVGDR
jgi:hypothetical protein